MLTNVFLRAWEAAVVAQAAGRIQRKGQLPPGVFKLPPGVYTVKAGSFEDEIRKRQKCAKVLQDIVKNGGPSSDLGEAEWEVVPDPEPTEPIPCIPPPPPPEPELEEVKPTKRQDCYWHGRGKCNCEQPKRSK